MQIYKKMINPLVLKGKDSNPAIVGKRLITDALKARMTKISADIPPRYVNFILEKYPEYDSRWGRNYIRNVRNKLQFDEKLTTVFEGLAKKSKKQAA